MSLWVSSADFNFSNEMYLRNFSIILLNWRNCWFVLNTSYLADSNIVFTLKLESRQIFCSNRWIRSSKYGKKNISDFPPCGKRVIFVTEFVIFCKTPPFCEVKWIRRKWLPHWGISKIFFLDHFSPSFLGQKWLFQLQILFWPCKRWLNNNHIVC